LKLGLDYFINPGTTVGFVATGFVAPQNQHGFTTSYLKDGNSNITSIERTTRTVDNTWKNGTFNINFHTSLDSSKKDITGNLDYLHYDFSGNQEVNGLSYNPNEQLQLTSYLKNILPLQDSLSNDFNYRENINAAYLNINKRFGDWTVQAGLRAENTNYKGLQNSYSGQQDSSFSRSYTNLFPTAFIGYQLNENNQFGISAGRRIDRPAYQQLNPFVSYIDKYMRMAGNPWLQPQFSNNLELSHTYKNMFTTTLNYSVVNNMMNETLVNIDSLIIRSVGNIGTRYNFGIAESATIPFTKWYTSIFFANLYENKYDGQVNGYSLNAKQLALSLNINNQFSFQKGWSAELLGVYTTKDRDEGQAVSLPIGQVSAGISKQLLNNKASLKLNVRDIFYTQTIREIQNFQNVQSTVNRARDTRVVNIAFVFRFGKQSKPKASQATDEQKRIQVN